MGAFMDLVLKGRGVRVTEQLRRVAAHKLGKLARLDPRAVRVVLEVISERNPRQNGTKRLEASLDLPRHTLRARAQGPDVEVALDQLADRLERQIRDHHRRKRNRLLGGVNRLKSSRISPEGAAPSE
jgi:ribosomal subunit interface protein